MAQAHEWNDLTNGIIDSLDVSDGSSDLYMVGTWMDLKAVPDSHTVCIYWCRAEILGNK